MTLFLENKKDKRSLLTMKFDTIDVCQNKWYPTYGIKKTLSTNICIYLKMMT